MALIPKKLLILQRLTAVLQGITPANGYAMDLSNAVFRGRSTYGADAPLPCLSILEAPKPDTGLFGGTNSLKFTEEWMLMLQGWAVDDDVNPSDPAYELEAAVRKRLYVLIGVKSSQSPIDPELYLLGRLVSCVLIGPAVIRPPEANASAKAFFYLPLRVSLQTDVSQPYVEA